MSFRDLDEFFDSSLRLPIRGKTYLVPSPPAEDGLWIMRMLTTADRARAGEEIDAAVLAGLQLDDAQERSLYERCLGPALPEMLADGVPWEMVKHAGTTAFIWVGGDRATAERYWSSPPGEAPAPNRAARRASKATATSTRPRGSTAGTTSRQKPKRAKA